MNLESLRKEYHISIFKELLNVNDKGIPNNADKYSKISVKLAKEIVKQIAIQTNSLKLSGQTAGKSFEKLTLAYQEKVFSEINHLRSGKYEFFIGRSIEDFEQYEHLATVAEMLKKSSELRATLGDYIISPDIVIGRLPVDDKEINQHK